MVVKPCNFNPTYKGSKKEHLHSTQEITPTCFLIRPTYAKYESFVALLVKQFVLKFYSKWCYQAYARLLMADLGEIPLPHNVWKHRKRSERCCLCFRKTEISITRSYCKIMFKANLKLSYFRSSCEITQMLDQACDSKLSQSQLGCLGECINFITDLSNKPVKLFCSRS